MVIANLHGLDRFSPGILAGEATYLMQFSMMTRSWTLVGTYGTTVTGQASPGFGVDMLRLMGICSALKDIVDKFGSSPYNSF